MGLSLQRSQLWVLSPKCGSLVCNNLLNVGFIVLFCGVTLKFTCFASNISKNRCNLIPSLLGKKFPTFVHFWQKKIVYNRTV